MPSPTSPWLDNFDRPDENPISYGGRWQPLTAATVTLRGLSSNLTPVGTSGSARWGPLTLTDSEVWVEVADAMTGGSSQMSVAARTSDFGTTWDGYILQHLAATMDMSVVTNGSLTSLGSVSGVPTPATGDRVALVIQGTQLEAWRYSAGGVWTKMIEKSDSTYSSGAIGVFLGQPGGSVTVGLFGGGTPATDARTAPPMIGRARW